jgi:hypothetical protein
MGICEIYMLFYMLQKWSQRDKGYAARSSGICPFISGQAVPYILKECSATQKFYSSNNTASPTPEHLVFSYSTAVTSNLAKCRNYHNRLLLYIFFLHRTNKVSNLKHLVTQSDIKINCHWKGINEISLRDKRVYQIKMIKAVVTLWPLKRVPVC